MKKLFLPFLLALFFIGCEKDSTSLDEQNLTTDKEITDRGPNPKVDVCHYDAENDSWHLINVSENAWPAHEAHGDVLLVDNDGDGWVTLANECGLPVDCDDTDPELTDNCVPDCCFNEAVEELNLTCWNGDPNSPILWDEDAFYGLCSSCNGGVCSYRTPNLGFYADGSPAPEACRLYLVQLAEDLGLGIGPTCNRSSDSEHNHKNGNGVFGQQ